jgi:glycosyltransferase involved in cell wall biosynthesis
MDAQGQPLVSIVTPVYNGEEYLRQSIESVLAQTYENWDYLIVNNCSTDRTLDIAQEYAAGDARIRVHSNESFAPIIENHNIAVRNISPQSKYCKVLFADDLLFPQCLKEMVKIAEEHLSVGIVGAYALDGAEVAWDGLPYPSTVVSGRELCRNTLLGGPYVFGTPTALLIRSDLIRARNSFYNESNLHADYEVCFDVLQNVDFGFVHQVLVYSRPREGSNATVARSLSSHGLGSLETLVKYGRIYLTSEEYEARLRKRTSMYYGQLAKNFLRLRGGEFWEYHRTKLDNLGMPLSRTRLARAVVREVLESLSRPLQAVDGVLNWWPHMFSRGHKSERGRN